MMLYGRGDIFNTPGLGIILWLITVIQKYSEFNSLNLPSSGNLAWLVRS